MTASQELRFTGFFFIGYSLLDETWVSYLWYAVAIAAFTASFYYLRKDRRA